MSHVPLLHIHIRYIRYNIYMYVVPITYIIEFALSAAAPTLANLASGSSSDIILAKNMRTYVQSHIKSMRLLHGTNEQSPAHMRGVKEANGSCLDMRVAMRELR